jgi:hypothetical protein
VVVFVLFFNISIAEHRSTQIQNSCTLLLKSMWASPLFIELLAYILIILLPFVIYIYVYTYICVCVFNSKNVILLLILFCYVTSIYLFSPRIVHFKIYHVTLCIFSTLFLIALYYFIISINHFSIYLFIYPSIICLSSPFLTCSPPIKQSDIP